MTKLLVLYPHPKDAAEFERRYREEHTPMVHEKIAGLRKFFAGRIVGSAVGAAPYARVAELTFDSLEALQAAMNAPGGQAVVGHAFEISTGGPMTALFVEEDS